MGGLSDASGPFAADGSDRIGSDGASGVRGRSSVYGQSTGGPNYGGKPATGQRLFQHGTGATFNAFVGCPAWNWSRWSCPVICSCEGMNGNVSDYERCSTRRSRKRPGATHQLDNRTGNSGHGRNGMRVRRRLQRNWVRGSRSTVFLRVGRIGLGPSRVGRGGSRCVRSLFDIFYHGKSRKERSEIRQACAFAVGKLKLKMVHERYSRRAPQGHIEFPVCIWRDRLDARGFEVSSAAE